MVMSKDMVISIKKVMTMTVIIITITIVPISLVSLVYATLHPDHILKDIAGIFASMEVAVEGTLEHVRDYASLAVEFLLEELEESKVSKHKQISANITAYYDYEYELIEDIRYKAEEVIAVNTEAEISITIEEEGE